MKKAAPELGGFLFSGGEAGFLETEAFVLLLELRHAAASVEEAGRAAGPSRVDGGVDVERQLVALRAPSRAHLKDVTVCHFDVDDVVFGVKIFSHDDPFLTQTFWVCSVNLLRYGPICRDANEDNTVWRGGHGHGAQR